VSCSIVEVNDPERDMGPLLGYLAMWGRTGNDRSSPSPNGEAINGDVMKDGNKNPCEENYYLRK
jgi:hypothetical protein